MNYKTIDTKSVEEINMKKITIVFSTVIVVIICLIVGIFIFKHYNTNGYKYKGQGTDKLEKHGNTVLIVQKNIDCIPVIFVFI